MQPKPSIKEKVVAKRLAEELGVSVSTISRAFSPNSAIGNKTRQRVLQRAKELGYQPNPYAQSLITQRTKIAGIIVSDITNPFYPEVLTGLTEALQKIGLNVMLFTGNGENGADEAIPLALRYQPDLVVVMAATVSSQVAVQATAKGTHLVFFNRYVPDSNAFTVICDNRLGGREVADYLIETGHQKLAFVAGLPGATTSQDRWKGFLERCRERGHSTPVKEEAGLFSHDAGYTATLRLLSGDERPDAVFCANDILALGALDAITSLKLRVPEDIAVVGFDDIAMASWHSYSLTTYHQPVKEMVSVTVELAQEIIAGGVRPPLIRCIAGHLVKRRTTKR
ncbi:LacI family DNA-binding transcriptional regulator [Halomonas sp. WWR20]